MRWLWAGLLAWVLARGAAVVAEPLYEFGFNVRARMRLDSDRNANLLLYSQFGEYSSVHVALHDERGWSLFFAQKLQNFDKTVDSEEAEQAFLAYAGRGWRLQVGKLWMPFGQGMGERELGKGTLLTLPFPRGNTLHLAFADNGRGRQRGLFIRVGSPQLGVSVATGQNLGISKTAFHLGRGESYEPQLGRGYGLLVGVDARQVAGITLWRVEAIVAREGRLPDTEFVIVQASTRLPAGLSPVIRAEVDRQAREVRWLVSVQQNIGSAILLYPQVVFRRADFEQANLELRVSL